MAPKDLIKSTGNVGPDRPPGITCERYARGEGKRCIHYLPGGLCSLPDTSSCVEWLKANKQASKDKQTTSAAPLARDLFGNPIPQPAAVVSKARPQPSPTPSPVPAVPVVDTTRLRGFTTDDIESFKALGVEVCLQSESFGELWLVPSYTGQARRELTPEHLATVLHALSVFPGSRVTAFYPPVKSEPSARKETP